MISATPPVQRYRSPLPWKWAIADTHFLLRDVRYRPADADDLIVQAWRDHIQPGDTVLHLGDVNGYADPGTAARRQRGATSGLARRLTRLVRDLPGHVTLIAGNWDTPDTLEIVESVGWQVVRDRRGPPAAGFTLFYRGRLVEFLHFDGETNETIEPGQLQVHGHYHPPSPGIDGLHEPGEASHNFYELDGFRINVAASVRAWRPTLLAAALDERIARTGGSEEGAGA